MNRRGVILTLACAGSVFFGITVAGVIGGYRLNLTPSEPLGLWRIEPLRRPVAVGDLVFICPPVTAAFEAGRRHGYLRSGLCAGGLAPLIKTVAALPGQHIEITDLVVIDGTPLATSGLRKRDAAGRSMTPDSGGVVPRRHLFLHSSFASSYDSRYFGPVPEAGLLGLARPVLTFDP